MRNRKAWLLAALSLAAWLGWREAIRPLEVVTLVVPRAGVQDHYARLWVVDDGPYVWIRAETPDRSWLDAIEERTRVTLWRNGEKQRFRATVHERAAPYVDPLFREKYGLVDRVRELVWRRHSVPIRLKPDRLS